MTTCTIKGRYLDSAAAPVQGVIWFTPSPAALINGDDDVITVPTRISAPLDEDGSFEVVVPATDDPDNNPTNWTYTVQEGFAGGRTYAISAPGGQTIDLADVSPVPVSNGDHIVVGPQGPVGPKGEDGEGIGDHLTNTAAHDAKNIAFSAPLTDTTATDVEGAIVGVNERASNFMGSVQAQLDSVSTEVADHVAAPVAHNASAIEYDGDASGWLGDNLSDALTALDDYNTQALDAADEAIMATQAAIYEYVPNFNYQMLGIQFAMNPGTDPDTVGNGTPTYRGAPFDEFVGYVQAWPDMANAYWEDEGTDRHYVQVATYTGTAYMGPLRRAIRYGIKTPASLDHHSPTWGEWQGFASDETV